MPWGVYGFPWGAAVRNEDADEWTNIVLSNGEMIVVEGLDVELSDEGVRFKE